MIHSPSTRFVRLTLIILTLGVLGAAQLSSAQAIGTFRWQQQPYCNVVTLSVVQSGGIYQVDGFDDQCGAGTRASASGLAFPNPNGTIGFGLTLVTTPGGIPLHIDATIALANLSGTWRDTSGATGAWTFTQGAHAAGSARPVPRASFPAGLSAGGTTITNVAAPVNATDATNRAYVDATTRTAASLTRNLTAYGSRVTQSIAFAYDSGCLAFATNANGEAQLDLDLPFGAVPSSVAVKYVDNSPGVLDVHVHRYTFEEGVPRSDTVVGLHSSTNGPGAGNRVSNVAVTGNTPVSVSTGYYLTIYTTPYPTGALMFCGAQVTYTLP